MPEADGHKSFAMQSFMGLGDLIEAIKMGAQKRQSFCVYAREDNNGLKLEQNYFVDNYPTGGDDEDVFPELIQQFGLSLAYHGEQFEDLIGLALDQKSNASLEDFVRALNHYMTHDDFLDLQHPTLEPQLITRLRPACLATYRFVSAMFISAIRLWCASACAKPMLTVTRKLG
jgi:hypothetical protein